MTVRIATRKDEEQVMSLCRALHADNGLFEMDDDLVRQMLDRAFNRQGGIIGIIDGDKEIAAAIFLLISHFWYSREEHLEEIFAFVRPAYRQRGYIDQLCDEAERCSRELGLPLVIGVITNKRMEGKVRLYRRKFGLPKGAFFIVGGKWGEGETLIDDKNLWRERSYYSMSERRFGKHSNMTTSAVPMLPLVGAK